MKDTLTKVVIALVAAIAVLFAGVDPASASVVAVLGATTTTASLDQAMKIIYSDPIVTDVVNDSEIVDLFKTDMNVRTEETTGGKYVEMAHYLRLAGAAQARAENDYIPVPESPAFANSRIFLKKLIGVVEMTGDVMEKVVSDEGAFIDYMDRALPDTKERLVEQLDRMYIGFGAGIKARVVTGRAASSSTTILLDRALGVTGYQDPWLQFSEGERIVFSSTPAGSVLRNAGTGQSALVESIDPANNSLVVTADTALLTAIVGDDYIFPGDAAGTSSQNGGVDREVSGLLAGVDNGNILSTYNNISRTTTPSWKSTVFDASGAPYNGVVTEKLLIILDAITGAKASAKIDVIVMSPHGPIGYWGDLKTQRSINDPRNYTGGYGKMAIQLGDRTLPLRTARKLPPQVAFGLSTSTWRRFTLGTWQWDDRTGSIWKQVTDNVGRKDAFFAYGKMYEQLACIRPRGNFRIDGLLRQFNY